MPKVQRRRREKDEKAWQKKQKKKICQFCKDKVDYVDYKDANTLRKYVSERGKIRSRRVTGNCVQDQRDVVEVKDGYARNCLIPRGMAVSATKGGMRHADRLSKNHRDRVAKARREAETV